MMFLETWRKEQEIRDEAKRQALSALRANPLRLEPWMTARDRSDWIPYFCNSGTAGAMKCWGVREALRFRAASSRCRSALEADEEWRALVLLAQKRLFAEATESREVRMPDVKDVVAAHEKIMHFCVRNSSFQLRLELGGIDDELSEEYKSHPALQFANGHTCLCGAVAHLHLGYEDDDAGSDDESSDSNGPNGVLGFWANGEWSIGPRNFLSQLKTCVTSVRVTAHYKGVSHTIAETFIDDPSIHSFTAAVNALSPLMQFQYGGDEVLVHMQIQIPTSAYCHFVGLGQYRSYPTLQLWEVPTPLNDNSSPLALFGVLWSSEGIDMHPDHDDDFDMARDHYGAFSFRFDGQLSLQRLASDFQDTRIPVAERARIALSPMLDNVAQAANLGSDMLRTLCALVVQNMERLTDATVEVPPELEAETVGALVALVELAGHNGDAIRGMSAVNALAAVADMANDANTDSISYNASISSITDSDWNWMEETYEIDRLSLWALDSLGRTRFQMHGLTLGSHESRAWHRPRVESGDSRHASGMNGKVTVLLTPGHLRLTFMDSSMAELVLGEDTQ
eukprot:TRINITY_DN30910_c0_g1_i1.p1 TRINITY_DN30910_c0_g1~~TRINITY_DN30910_c0_g1_i1.p1  ORF type:complete len:567 (+),score=49.27 TRINITY_DN30910_c0_g1_i1:60-1760(+)